MIEFNEKKIYFSARGENFDRDELVKYFLQKGGEMVDDPVFADMIIQGYMTPVYMQERFYLLSKEGKELIDIGELEKQFCEDIDIDSVIMAIRISKDNERLIKLLNNRYLGDDIFVKLLKYYNWGTNGLYDTDHNRDISTAVVNRFCSLKDTNHNIQHSPVGIYFTALETSNCKLLEAFYSMPNYKISEKNAKDDQPLTLKEVIALNPNTPKPVLMQILKDNNIEELRFLALNGSINNMICKRLYDLNDHTIIKNLVKGGNLLESKFEEVLGNKDLKRGVLENIELKDETFNMILSMGNLNNDELVMLSLNSSLSTIQIDRLLKYGIKEMNLNLLKKPNCERGILKEFFEKNDPVYNIALSSNTNLTDELFEKLYFLDLLDINRSLSMNTKTPKHIIKGLFEKSIDEINTNLSVNINTPINILMQLQLDNRYSVNVSNNETYKEFSRNSLGIIQDKSNRFKRTTYDMDSFFNE